MSDQALSVPPQAVKYILFQRTPYLFFRRSHAMQWLKFHLPGFLASPLETVFTKFDTIVGLEAQLTKNKVAQLFTEDMEQEYQDIRAYLPTEASAILDVGAGIGGIDVFLYKHYAGAGPAVYLLDKTEMPRKVYYGIRQRGCFYNSLELAREFLVRNGVPGEKVFLGEAGEANKIPFEGPFDLIISLISWGFHYPVDTYLTEAYEKLKPGGVLILDIRRTPEHDGVEEVRKKFGNVQIIRAAGKHARIVASK